MSMRRVFLTLLAATTVTSQHLPARLLSVTIDAQTGDYNITLTDAVTGGNIVFVSTPLVVLYDGTYLSSGDGSLVRVGGSNSTAGTDGMGDYRRVAVSWSSPAHPDFSFTTAFRAYDAAGGDGACALVFEQRFDSGIPVTARPDLPQGRAKTVGHIAAFPSLQLQLPPASPALGLLTFQGSFAGAKWTAGAWPSSDAPRGWVEVSDWDVVPTAPNASYILHGPTASALACGTACATNASCAGVYTWSAVTAACYFKREPAWGGAPYARRFSGCNPSTVAGCPSHGPSPPTAGGFSTGPHVLVCPSRGCHAVLSPLTHALVGFQVLRSDGSLASGTQDRAATVPPGYTYETLLSAAGASAVPRPGTRGPSPAVADALFAWGGAMLAFHAKPRTRPDAHAIISSLGYCTNAYYFYCSLDGKNSTVGNLAEMHVAVQTAAVQEQLPFRFHFLTSQFYGEHEYAMGVHRWDDESGFGHMPQRFPPPAGSGPGGGMAAMWSALAAGGLRGVSAHLGRWRSDTPYLTANASWEWLTSAAGGTGGTAVPLSADFWTQLLGHAAHEWGLLVLEQDHMDDSQGAVGGLLTTIDGYERWLDGQGTGAAAAGVAIEYCMDLPSVVMHSATVRAATHSRGGADYVPGQNTWQWDVTVPSALLHSLGLFVSKDTYYSSSTEANPRPKAGGYTDDCPFGSNFTEAYPATHHLAATLSRGLVQPSDGVGLWDAPLVRTAARSDGLLLKPDAPARRIEATWERLMFQDANAPVAGGALSTTFTVISATAWHFVLAVALAAPYSFTPSDLLLPPPADGRGYIAVPFEWAPPGPYGWNLSAAHPFDSATPLLLTPGISYSPAAYLLAPILRAAVVVFGEIGKVAAMSAQRTTAFSQDAASGVVTLSFDGDAAGEDIAWGFACTAAANSAPQTLVCHFPASNMLVIDCSASVSASCAVAVRRNSQLNS